MFYINVHVHLIVLKINISEFGVKYYDVLLQVYRSNVGTHSVDASDITRSNWLRYMNCARHSLEQNVEASMCYGRVLYRTSRDIPPGKELFIYYGDAYARYLNINVKQYWNKSYNYLEP